MYPKKWIFSSKFLRMKLRSKSRATHQDIHITIKSLTDTKRILHSTLLKEHFHFEIEERIWCTPYRNIFILFRWETYVYMEPGFTPSLCAFKWHYFRGPFRWKYSRFSLETSESFDSKNLESTNFACFFLETSALFSSRLSNWMLASLVIAFRRTTHTHSLSLGASSRKLKEIDRLIPTAYDILPIDASSIVPWSKALVITVALRKGDLLANRSVFLCRGRKSPKDLHLQSTKEIYMLQRVAQRQIAITRSRERARSQSSRITEYTGCLICIITRQKIKHVNSGARSPDILRTTTWNFEISETRRSTNQRERDIVIENDTLCERGISSGMTEMRLFFSFRYVKK